MKKLLILLVLLIVVVVLFALGCNCGQKFEDYLTGEVSTVVSGNGDFNGISYKLDGQDVYVSGDTKDNDSLNLLLQQIMQIPGVESVNSDVNVASDQQQEPVFVQQINFSLDKDSNKIQLRGVVADQAEMDAILASLQGYEVDNQLTIAPLPQEWTGKSQGVIALAKKFERLKMSIDGDHIGFKGDISADQRADLIEFELRKLFPNAQIKSDIALAGLSAAARSCQTELKNFLDDNVIQFAVGSAEIVGEAQDVLAELIGIVSGCEEVHLTIVGHTDNTGTDDINNELSKARAQSVQVALQQANIAAERLTSIGYGSSRPIASNETEQGRQLNRRIEIWIK